MRLFLKAYMFKAKQYSVKMEDVDSNLEWLLTSGGQEFFYKSNWTFGQKASLLVREVAGGGGHDVADHLSTWHPISVTNSCKKLWQFCSFQVKRPELFTKLSIGLTTIGEQQQSCVQEQADVVSISGVALVVISLVHVGPLDAQPDLSSAILQSRKVPCATVRRCRNLE
jgi:hypothetical protein